MRKARWCKRLAHQQVREATRMLGDTRDNGESVPLIERRRLERERHQDDLRAAASARLLFGQKKQPRAESLATSGFVDPELPDLTGASPGISADAGDQATALADQECQILTVDHARDSGVEVVET